jgi:3-oxoacyl-[acyl-carrier-protein] synthase-3
MIFSDGAGCCILEFKETGENGSGMIGASVQSHCNDEAYYINMGCSYLPETGDVTKYIKMKGRKVYEYAVTHVPAAMKDCLDKTGIEITDLKKVFIHQANEKMDEVMIKKLYKLYDINAPENIMPMSIHWLGNSSVATVPTLLDLVLRGKQEGHTLNEGDVVLFASVGAGMNINAVAYRM